MITLTAVRLQVMLAKLVNPHSVTTKCAGTSTSRKLRSEQLMLSDLVCRLFSPNSVLVLIAKNAIMKLQVQLMPLIVNLLHGHIGNTKVSVTLPQLVGLLKVCSTPMDHPNP